MRIASGIALALALALPVVAFACSGSSDNPPPVDAGSDAPETAPPDLDAGPDIEQPPDIYPAHHADIPQLDYLGGPVLDHLKLVTVTFYHAVPAADAGIPDAAVDDAGKVHVPDSLTNTLRSYDDMIIKSDWWHQTMGGYKVSDGSGGLYAELDDTPVANQTVTDDQIQQVIKDGIAGGHLPSPQDQILYAMYFPTSTKITNFNSAACADFLGYHYQADIVVGTGTTAVAYAVLPRCQMGSALETLQQLTITASHEFAEAASDPFPATNGGYRLVTNDAWVPPLGLGSAGNENGDVCIFAPAYDESGWKVQPIWSNKAASESHEPCEPQPVNASPIYYGAALRTDKQKVNNHNSFGYLLIDKGKSVDGILDFFSTAALPHDVNLYVGIDKGTGDPTDLKELPNGITATLSRSQVHNGNGVIMTVSVPANAVSGDWRFLIRSVLEKDDFHDWPVLVHVK
jgi:hypothetical protein